MTLKNGILIPVLIAPLIPAIVMGFTGFGWFYFLTFFCFYICFGVMELLSVKFRGKTISQDISNTKPKLFWSIIGTWIFFTIGLCLHWYLGR